MNVNKILMNLCSLILMSSIFLLGWYVHSMASDIGSINLETPFSDGLFTAKERFSPGDHISESQILVTSEKVTLSIPDAQWAELADTNSMDPLMDKGANTIEITPKIESVIEVGDIIAYTPNNFNGKIIHRVVEIGTDSAGWYCRAKGDNLSEQDPGKIRFSQISGLLVAIIY